MIVKSSQILQSVRTKSSPIRFIDLFCGIGGFRIGLENSCHERGIKPECVFSSDIDPDAQFTYAANFNEEPAGDITQINADDIPSHDILLAGFPCQAFSICGDRKGFEDTRGTLFFDIARILDAKKPSAFVLENVKQLRTHNQGKTFQRIIALLQDLGYDTHYQILNALNFGLPQKRERIFIVGFRQPTLFTFPVSHLPMRSLSEMLEEEVSESYYASSQIRQNRIDRRKGKEITFQEPTIWHENKGGNVSVYPYSCAMRAGASYNYLLVNGVRRLTEREMLRLQGFPDSYQIVCGYSAMRKLTGNSVAIPCVTAVVGAVLDIILDAD
jgi:DNA (cytosine-5)-methyltransferase 1